MTSDKTRSKIRVRALVLAQALILLASLGVPMAALAVDGDGSVTVSPTTVVSGSTGNTLTFVHTLASSWTTGQNVVRLQITVPGGGWSAPTLAAGAGRVAISAETCPGTPTIGVSGSNIQISGTNSNCQAGNTVTITYAATAGTTVGANTFTSSTRTAGNAGALTAVASSPVVTVTAPKVNTTTAITSHTPDPSVAGSAISVGVSVTRASGTATPGGTVTVSDGTDTSAPCTLSGSGATATATCSLTPSTSGAKTLTATYGGDAAFNGSSGTASHTVNKANSTTTITSDTPDPSIIGSAVSVGVSVTRASGSLTPGGTVTVSDGTVTSAPCALAGSFGTATATCSLTPSTAGVKTLTATYGGNTAFNGSSGTAAHTVTGADGSGTVAIHWDSVGNYAYGDPTVTPGMSLELIDFNFTATAPMAAGSQVTITIPAGWTPPTIADSPGVLAINPTTPALTTPTCTLPTAGTPQMAVSGSGPWTITIDVTCAAGSTFRVRWGNTLANVITAPAAGTYVFTTQSKGPGGTLTSIPAPQPTITVVKLNQAALSITAPAIKTYGDVPFTPTTSGGSGTGAVTFTSSTPAVCTASGSATVTIVGAGTCSVTATKAADANYNARTSASYDITVNKANQAPLVVTGTSSPAGYGSTQTLGTTGGSGTGAVTYSTGASTACSVVGNVLTITASTGTCSVTATKATDANYNARTSAAVSVTVAKGVLVVTPDAQSRTFGQAVPVYTFNVTGFAAGENAGNAAGYAAPTCTSTYTAATPVVSSPLTITCSGGSATNYTFNTTATALLTINKANQAALSIAAPATKTYGDVPFTPTTSGGSGTGAVTFTSSTPAVCTASGSATVTIVGAGTCSVTATKAADANYNARTSASYDITVDQAGSTTVVTCPANVTYTGSAQTPCSVTVTGPGGLSLTPDPTYADNTDAGTATASYAYAGDANHTGSSDSGTFVIDQAGSTTVVTCPANVTYTGSAQTPCSVTVTGPGGLSLTPDPTYADNTDAGTATASYAYAGDANHTGSSDSGTFVIDQAGSTTVVTCPANVTYTGSAQTPCSVTVTGPGGLSLTPDPTYADNTDAGTATASYAYAGDANHTGSSDSGTFVIDQAGSTTVVTCPANVTYTGSAQTPCSVTVTGPGGLSLTPDPTYADNTDAGTATASYAYAGDANHTGSSDSGTFVIDQAGSTTVVTCPANVTYTGSAQTPCSVTVTGPGGLSLTPDPTYADNTDAGTATASYAYAGDANHTGSSDSGTFVIDQADANCTITGYTGTYDGAAHGATGSCTGVNGEILAGLDLGASFTNVPGGTADWTLNNANYNARSGSVAITIGKAQADCTVTGYAGTYDGAAHGATGSCTGVGGTLLAGLDLGASFTDVPGGAADWLFANRNYFADSGSVDIDISAATQAIEFPPMPNVKMGAEGFVLGATTDSGLPVTYTSLTPDVCTVSGTTVTIVGVGTCSIEASQAGDGNHGPAQTVTQSFRVLPTDSSTPETSTASPFAILGGSGSIPPGLLLVVLAAGILAAVLTLLGLRARRDDPQWRDSGR